MEPINGSSGNHNPKSNKHKSLLTKYDIPINHLSFEYVGNCNDIKELERIVKILKCGEEGYYPDLLRSAEERLRKIHPNSRVLRVEEPVLTKANFNEEEWNEVASDLKAWTCQMGIQDNELLEANNNSNVDPISYPNIRKTTAPKKKSHTSCVGGSTTVKRIASTDYRSWDKYDADTEIMKMDLEEERQKQHQQTKVEKKKISSTDKEEVRLQSIIKEAEKLTQTEREVLANGERNKGNEYYKGNYFDDAIRCYTTSIAIHPTALAYSNRACCYLKQCKYTAALNDCNKALEMDPNNVKAYFRRGQALQHKNRFYEAVRDMEEVLKREPHQKMARHALCELRAHIRSLPKKFRLLVRDAEQGKKIVEVSKYEWLTNPKLRKAVEVNEWGLAKQPCSCYGTPSFVRNTSNLPRKAEHLLIRKQESGYLPLPLTNGIMEDDNQMQIDSDIGFSNQCRSGFSGDVNRDMTGTSVRTLLDEDDDDEDDDDDDDYDVNDSNAIRSNVDVNVDDEDDEDDDDDGEDPFENNGNFYFGSSRKDPVNDNNNPITEIGSLQNPISFNFGSERDDQPKRLEILEIETDDTPVSGDVSSSKSPDTCCPMDITEKHSQPSRINGNLGLCEQEFVRSGAIPKTKFSMKSSVDSSSDNDNQKTIVPKTSVNNSSKKTGISKETKKSSDFELEMCFNKIPTISIANKYKQKVVKSSETDKSALVVPNDCDDMPDLEEVPDMSPKKISPFQFGSLWTSKESSSSTENANLLRKIQPSLLHSLIGNKLDDQMLSSILRCLSSEFDLSKEQDLVQEYLSALTHLERFNVIKSFMPQQDKNTVCELIDKLNDAQVKQALHQAFGV